MLLQIMYSIILLNITVLKCTGEKVQENENISELTNNYGNITEIRLENKDAFCTFQQLQLDVIRSEQIRQSGLLNELIGKFNELNENFIKLSSSESNKYHSSCAEATALTRRSGVYQIHVANYSLHPIIVSCEEKIHGGGWTTVLRREDGSVDFYLFWKDFKNGFGNVIGEFFIGLEKLHFMTTVADQELLIVMEDFKGQHRFAKYDRFEIGSEDEAYKMRTLGTYSGDAGDALKAHAGQKFTTRDRDNDLNTGNCAVQFTGGWWYNNCHFSNLMGRYNDTTHGKGINWLDFTTHTASLKRLQMMIRPRIS